MKLQLSAHPRASVGPGAWQPLALRDAVLLAWLAVEGPSSRDRLATLLWPDSAPDAARNALRQRLFLLKKQLGESPIQGKATLALAAHVEHDLSDGSDLLGDEPLSLHGEFANWLAAQREQRRLRTCQTLVERADGAERAGDWPSALAHATELLALVPTSEEAHRRLMRLHYLAGDRAAALQAFDACERLLKDEVGTRPGAETLALLATLEAASLPVPPPARVPAALVRPPRLFGRDIERAVLAAALQTRQVLLLHGEPGMGKSRLLDDLAESHPGLVVAGARPGDAAVPFALVGRWLRALLMRPGLALQPGEREALSPLLPELGAPAAAVEYAQLRAAVESVFGRAVAAGLPGVVVDDLQFADEASVVLLQGLAEGGDVGWVIALRPAERGPAAQALCQALEQRSGTQVLALPPLAAPDVAALLAATGLPALGHGERAASLCAHTGGNPLYLIETLKAALQQAPGDGDRGAGWPLATSVLRLIQQRLARLSPGALRLARCAAVAGQDLDPVLAAAVLGLPVLDLADAWAELEAAQVLRDRAFAHDLIAEAALGLVPAAVARPLHGQVAAWMEAHEGEPARVAGHWMAAQQPLRAVPALQAAARRARTLWQNESAAEAHARAGEILAAAGRRAEAFDAFFWAAEAISDYRLDERFRRWCDQLDGLADDDAQRAAAACARVALLAEDRRQAEARQLAERGLALARRCRAADVEIELLWSLTVLDWERRELDGALRHAEAALLRLPEVDPAHRRLALADTHFKLLHGVGVMQAAVGRYAESDRRLEQAIEVASRYRGRQWALGIAATLAHNAREQGDGPRAQHWMARALQDDDRDEVFPNIRVNALTGAALIQTCVGDLGAALVHAEKAVALCDRHPVRNAVSARTRLALLQLELGRRDLALRGLHALAAQPDQHGPERARVHAALLAAGEALPAHEVLDEIGALDDLPLRAMLLCQAQPGCTPAAVLPLLTMTAATARERGARGLWLALQGRRVQALRVAGRFGEAGDAARAAWQVVQDGVTGTEWFPRIGAALAAALRADEPLLADTLALQVSSWVQRGASTLPPMWRESLLRRAAWAALPAHPLSG